MLETDFEDSTVLLLSIDLLLSCTSCRLTSSTSLTLLQFRTGALVCGVTGPSSGEMTPAADSSFPLLSAALPNEQVEAAARRRTDQLRPRPR